MDRSDATRAVEARSTARQELREVTNTLIAEYSGRLPAGTVIRCVARAREQLLRSGVRAGLPVAVEFSARIRLSTLVPAHGSAG